jgi:rhamnosyltransferase
MADPHHLQEAKVIIPTLNAGPHFAALRAGLEMQGIYPRQVLVIDSSSDDNSPDLFRRYGAQVVVIARSDFNHGGTRRLATRLANDAPILLFLTQDAIPAAANSFTNLLQAFRDPSVGVAYGRQLPRPDARGIERHARLINYPACRDEVRTFNDRKRYGIKTVFASNSFAAYRKDALESVGGFPEDALFAEDQIVAGKMLMQGWKVMYCSNSVVVHSHDYTLKQELRRYFDVGVFHARNAWLTETFGRAEGEGVRFVASEMRFLWSHDGRAIPTALAHTVAKYIGYRLGRLEGYWPVWMKRRLSMAPGYWHQPNGTKRRASQN